jgi:hypothetical protein
MDPVPDPGGPKTFRSPADPDPEHWKMLKMKFKTSGTGTMEIVCHTTGLKAVISFKPAGWYSGQFNPESTVSKRCTDYITSFIPFGPPPFPPI